MIKKIISMSSVVTDFSKFDLQRSIMNNPDDWFLVEYKKVNGEINTYRIRQNKKISQKEHGIYCEDENGNTVVFSNGEILSAERIGHCNGKL